jgi:beta-lactam-binding protein with PASTA domain
MTPCVIGLYADEAKAMLEKLGFEVRINEYQSRRGVEGADSVRVIRQRSVGNNSIEITVSQFKTQAG